MPPGAGERRPWAEIVLDGAIIAKHKVSAVMVDGMLQNTRCGDQACDILRAKLID